jgi:hypothetical protein
MDILRFITGLIRISILPGRKIQLPFMLKTEAKIAAGIQVQEFTGMFGYGLPNL